MTMTYELWDTKGSNLLDRFASEDAAMAAIREYLEVNGPGMIRDLVLGAVPETGLADARDLPSVVDGASLLARVLPTSSAPEATVIVHLAHDPRSDFVVRVASKIVQGSKRVGQIGRAAGAYAVRRPTTSAGGKDVSTSKPQREPQAKPPSSNRKPSKRPRR